MNARFVESLAARREAPPAKLRGTCQIADPTAVRARATRIAQDRRGGATRILGRRRSDPSHKADRIQRRFKRPTPSDAAAQCRRT